LDSALTIARPIESPEMKNAGDAWIVTPDVRSLTVRATIAPETENVGPVAVVPVKWPRLKNVVFFAKAIPDEDVMVRVDVKTEKVEQSIVTAKPVVGRFSNQFHY
jgi:hypothetical protein